MFVGCCMNIFLVSHPTGNDDDAAVAGDDFCMPAFLYNMWNKK